MLKNNVKPPRVRTEEFYKITATPAIALLCLRRSTCALATTLTCLCAVYLHAKASTVGRVASKLTPIKLTLGESGQPLSIRLAVTAARACSQSTSP